MKVDRFMVDDAGTLIDMVTRDTFDYVSDVCPLLNALNDENEQLKKQNENLQNLTDALERQLKICEYGDFKYE